MLYALNKSAKPTRFRSIRRILYLMRHIMLELNWDHKSIEL
jgi:hypothetical protein